MTRHPSDAFRKWLLVSPTPQPRLRLFCFPFAGGGASTYLPWLKAFPEGVEVCPVQLPGREGRRQELAFDRARPLVETLAQDLSPLFDRPFAFFGHSMGALISFELARELRRRRMPSPCHLFVSGHRAPHCSDPDPPMHDLPEPDFIKRMGELNGTPKEVLENLDLVRLFIPLMRRDAALCETYQHTPEEALSCPITAYGGSEDAKATREELDAWREHTLRGFLLQMFPGDHFYLLRDRLPLLRVLSSSLQELAGR